MLTFDDPHAMSLSIRASALVFEDPKSKAVLERINAIAPSDANVLIIGETGTGKELVARHVHALSARRNGAFLAVNCAALPESLVESELFGHEKGAFTGAHSCKEGWFEAAHGGTLFLDEIGDLPLAMQVKLLRVLQEREVTRVGSRQPTPINVRLIAATNVKLEEAVAAGRFRQDLYFRLNVASLFLPALRDRPGDIMPLADYFRRLYGKRLGCPDTEIGSAAQRTLLAHPWPGNIRELENVIHHAVLVARNNLISPGDLNLTVFPNANYPLAAQQAESKIEALEMLLHDLYDDELPDLYDKIDEIVMRSAYRHSKLNQLQTARLLGISRNVVRAKLLKFGDIVSGKRRRSLPDLNNLKIPMADKPSSIPRTFNGKAAEGLEDPLSGTESSAEWWSF